MCCDLVACVWFFGMCAAGGRGGGCVDLCECLTPFSFAFSLSLFPSETAHTHKLQTEALRTNKQPKSSLSTFDTMTNKSSLLGRNNASIHTHTHSIYSPIVKQQNAAATQPSTPSRQRTSAYNAHTHAHIFQQTHTHTPITQNTQLQTVLFKSQKHTHTVKTHTLALAHINNTHTFI